MFQDNSLIFAEDNKDVAKSTILDLNGSSLARAFVFMTLPANLTGVTITLVLGNAKTDSATVTQITSEVHYASTNDLARGIMYFPLPVNAYRYAQVAIDITASDDLPKNFVCGITDAPDNKEVHVAEHQVID